MMGILPQITGASRDEAQTTVFPPPQLFYNRQGSCLECSFVSYCTYRPRYSNSRNGQHHHFICILAHKLHCPGACTSHNCAHTHVSSSRRLQRIDPRAND